MEAPDILQHKLYHMIFCPFPCKPRSPTWINWVHPWRDSVNLLVLTLLGTILIPSLAMGVLLSGQKSFPWDPRSPTLGTNHTPFKAVGVLLSGYLRIDIKLGTSGTVDWLQEKSSGIHSSSSPGKHRTCFKCEKSQVFNIVFSDKV